MCLIMCAWKESDLLPPLYPPTKADKNLVRVEGIGPSTSTLSEWRSTNELHTHNGEVKADESGTAFYFTPPPKFGVGVKMNYGPNIY